MSILMVNFCHCFNYEVYIKEHMFFSLRTILLHYYCFKLFISLRSLLPILNLLGCAVCPEAQLWAAWAVANLTTYDASRFAR